MNTDGWNGRETLPKDGTKIQILWSNGKRDVGYFDRIKYGTPFAEEVTRVEHPEIYAEGGEWSTDFGEGDGSEFHPAGWLDLTANTEISDGEAVRLDNVLGGDNGE